MKDGEPNHEFVANDEFKGGNSVLATLKPEHEQSKAKLEQSKVKSFVKNLFVLSFFQNALCFFLVIKSIFKVDYPLWILGSASHVCFLLLGTSASLRWDVHVFSTPLCDRSL